MKANEFVKKFGWEKAKKVIELSPSNAQAVDAKSRQYYRFNPLQITGMKGMPWTIVLSECYFNGNAHPVGLEDLKRLVESWELIEFVADGDLDLAKNICELAGDMKYLQKRGKMILVDDIRQAIADVESCL